MGMEQSTAYKYTGKIDELIIENRAWSNDEIWNYFIKQNNIHSCSISNETGVVI